MVSDPYLDTTGKDLFVVARKDFDFLKTEFQVSGTVESPPDSAFQRSDFTSIIDPDGVDVTDQWVTNQLDPNDPSDDFDETHPDYVGDKATPENVGLFHDGGGNLAQKFQAPSDAEITTGVNDRHYRIRWKVEKDANNVITGTEQFNVKDAGELVFGAGVVSPAEVTASIDTTLSDDTIRDIIAVDAALAAESELYNCSVDVRSFDSLPPPVKAAVILYARGFIVDRDLQADWRLNSYREQNEQVRFSNTASGMKGFLFERADGLLEDFCALQGDDSPTVRVTQLNDWRDMARTGRLS